MGVHVVVSLQLWDVNHRTRQTHVGVYQGRAGMRGRKCGQTTVPEVLAGAVGGRPAAVLSVAIPFLWCQRLSCGWAVRGCLTEPLVWVFCTTNVLLAAVLSVALGRRQRLWACSGAFNAGILHTWGMVLIDSWCRRAQSTVDDTIPWVRSWAV